MIVIGKLESSPLQLSEDSSQLVQVFLWDCVKNNDVIKVNNVPIQLEVPQMCLHEALKDGRGIGQPKWHVFAFIKPEQPLCESHVSFALFLHPHLPISQFHVKDVNQTVPQKYSSVSCIWGRL